MKNPCQKKPMGFFWFFHFSSFIFLSGPKTGKSIFLHNEHLYLTRKGILRFFVIFGDVFSPNFFFHFLKKVCDKKHRCFLQTWVFALTPEKTWVGEKNQKKWWGPDRPKKNPTPYTPLALSGRTQNNFWGTFGSPSPPSFWAPMVVPEKAWHVFSVISMLKNMGGGPVLRPPPVGNPI